MRPVIASSSTAPVGRGSTTHIARYLDDGLTVVALTNLREGNPRPIARGIAGLYERELAPPIDLGPLEDKKTD